MVSRGLCFAPDFCVGKILVDQGPVRGTKNLIYAFDSSVWLPGDQAVRSSGQGSIYQLYPFPLVQHHSVGHDPLQRRGLPETTRTAGQRIMALLRILPLAAL